MHIIYCVELSKIVNNCLTICSQFDTLQPAIRFQILVRTETGGGPAGPPFSLSGGDYNNEEEQ